MKKCLSRTALCGKVLGSLKRSKVSDKNSLQPWPARQGTGLFKTCRFWALCNHFVLGPCSGPGELLSPASYHLPLAVPLLCYHWPRRGTNNTIQYNTNCRINMHEHEGQKWLFGSTKAIQQQLAFAGTFSLQASCCLSISLV